MADLIDRQAAIDTAIEAADKWDGGYSSEREGIIRKFFDKIPAAQPEHSVHIADTDHIWVDGKQYVSFRRFMEAEAEAKPKKGYWYTIERGEHGYSAGSFRCSVCGEPNRSYSPKPNFCGNCGADMRGKE